MINMNGQMIVDKIEEKIVCEFLDICFSVYVVKSQRTNPEHIGSAFLIGYCGYVFIITAAHVIQDPVIEKYDFFILNHKGQKINLNRSRFLGCFVFDRFIDVALFTIDLKLDLNFKKISHKFNFSNENRVATLIGFPSSKNKRPLNSNSKLTALYYTGNLIDKSAKEILMAYSNGDGRAVENSISPSGMSGGCAFSFDIQREILSEFSGNSIVYEGMLIERDKKSKNLKLLPMQSIAGLAKNIVLKLRFKDFYKYQADWYKNKTLNFKYKLTLSRP